MTAVVCSSALVSVICPRRHACLPARPASSGSLTAQSFCRTALFRSQKAVSVCQRARTWDALSSNSLDHGVQYANNVVPLEHQVKVGSLVHQVRCTWSQWSQCPCHRALLAGLLSSSTHLFFYCLIRASICVVHGRQFDSRLPSLHLVVVVTGIASLV
jgi:hypothetical protein